MSKEVEIFYASLIYASLIFIAGVLIGAEVCEKAWEQSAIKNEVGIYSPKTGEFQWIKKEQSK